jgi:hypothetical protein
VVSFTLLVGLGQLKKSNDLIGNRTSDLPACSILPRRCKETTICTLSRMKPQFPCRLACSLFAIFRNWATVRHKTYLTLIHEIGYDGVAKLFLIIDHGQNYKTLIQALVGVSSLATTAISTTTTTYPSNHLVLGTSFHELNGRSVKLLNSCSRTHYSKLQTVNFVALFCNEQILVYCHVHGCDYRRRFGLVFGFIAHLYNSLLHFTNHYCTKNGVLSRLLSQLVVSW